MEFVARLVRIHGDKVTNQTAKTKSNVLEDLGWTSFFLSRKICY